MPPDKKILTFNTGSSSIKFALYMIGKEEQLVFSGSLTKIGQPEGRCLVNDREGKILANERIVVPDHAAACRYLFSWLESEFADRKPDAVGHRMVHGGPLYFTPQPVTPELLTSLDALSPYAPQHLPPALDALRCAVKLFPAAFQVTCFDTSFHSAMPPIAKLYALPESIRNRGVQRYGFHGLSYEYILGELVRLEGPTIMKERIIIAHLGHGASMAAVKEGRSIETTMGFSPAGGLVMSTRTGDLDPGVILFLLEEGVLSPQEIKVMVTRRSGLLGVSARSGDMRELLAAEQSDSSARDAVELFCYQARKYIGALSVVLGGLDRVVFSGGIGENSTEIRYRLCQGLEFLGIRVDGRKNRNNKADLTDENGTVKISVIKTNEELMIARHTMTLLRAMRPEQRG
ncbi:acetate/propionate family kinase [Chlorobium sp. BLA1]|uniref:acetate/propionate family kinase n=1 Tax=Candidatus Chlorobium masyuteum TaxID=2716876 RepID=UPI0014234FEB|nr:acetate/propionate family kinase [Candidatus Chlorobium masyuteum]NHQ60823.1 acetate/propionate family kinase [Candidatus Chlorobium masyuteum]